MRLLSMAIGESPLALMVMMLSWSIIWIITEGDIMSRMHNPAHPGEVLREWLPEGMTVTQAAKELQVSRVTLSKVLNVDILPALKNGDSYR
ncbi:MAG: helix-turn-helix transcriptional regulator [Methylobacter sp.]